MIARIEGLLVEQSPTRIVVDVGGVGYEVRIPLSTFTELPDLDQRVALHIYTWVNEGAIHLYGFHSMSERVAFELLLKANRVGPKLAQTVLSGTSPAELLDAIRAGDVMALRAIPGVGSKMAERILLDLRDRIEALAASVPQGDQVTQAADTSLSARDQTLSALRNLGYSQAEAERVLVEAEKEAGSNATLESLVRASLKRLGSKK